MKRLTAIVAAIFVLSTAGCAPGEPAKSAEEIWCDNGRDAIVYVDELAKTTTSATYPFPRIDLLEMANRNVDRNQIKPKPGSAAQSAVERDSSTLKNFQGNFVKCLTPAGSLLLQETTDYADQLFLAQVIGDLNQ